MKIALFKFLIVFSFIITSVVSKSQGFIWVKGPNSINSTGLYGNMGTVNIGNNPGARSGAVSWKDASGNFWMFGGNGYDFIGNQGLLADLWKYDLVNNTWTWINGNNVIAQVGVYGIQGVTSNSTHPGSRYNSVKWQDANGNVYLFGGNGYDAFAANGYLNDLWKYNPTTNEWTWLKGNNSCYQTGNYGTINVPSNTNQPGARHSSLSWVDNAGNFWLFGGFGVTTNSTTSGYLDDLWKYDVTTNQWTWMKGNTIFDQVGVYGSLGVSSASNNPGSRASANGWVDATGNLLMFGGQGYSSSGASSGLLNDLWKYNVTTNEWMWLSGSNNINQLGSYGTKGVASVSNTPGARFGTLTWKDTYGNYWLSAGSGYSAINNGNLNDVWVLDPNAVTWKWIAGSGNSNLPGVYGNISTPNNNNVFGGRALSANWIDQHNNLWVFGGYGQPQSGNPGYLSDTWKYTNCIINPITTMSITSSNELPCANETISLTVSGSNTYTWQTTLNPTLSFIVLTPSITTTYSVITNNTNSCIYMATYTQSVNACVGMPENASNADFLIYPNPSHGTFKLKGVEDLDTKLVITNALGQIIISETLNEATKDLDFSLNKGMYFYAFIQNEEIKRKGKILIE